MPPMSRYFGVVTVLVMACLLAPTGVPASATPGVAGSGAVRAATTSSNGDDLAFHGDTVHASSSARRRPRDAWSGRRIYFRETIPAKWEWSLSRAVAKWNNSGGRIRFVRTTNPRLAQLTISYGDVGRAAGMATVGRTRHAWVRLNRDYHAADDTEARNRVEVMAIFAHELGHVLGFGHTSTPCSLMASMLDVVGCGMLPPSRPGYYRCRTLDVGLVTRFVRMYGGRQRSPGTWCLIDPLPPGLNVVELSAGEDDTAVLRWDPPTRAVPGSTVRVRLWRSAECGPTPEWAQTDWAVTSAGVWQASPPGGDGAVCVSGQLLNRYGAGRAPVTGSILR